MLEMLSRFLLTNLICVTPNSTENRSFGYRLKSVECLRWQFTYSFPAVPAAEWLGLRPKNRALWWKAVCGPHEVPSPYPVQSLIVDGMGLPAQPAQRLSQPMLSSDMQNCPDAFLGFSSPVVKKHLFELS